MATESELPSTLSKNSSDLSPDFVMAGQTVLILCGLIASGKVCQIPFFSNFHISQGSGKRDRVYFLKSGSCLNLIHPLFCSVYFRGGTPTTLSLDPKVQPR